MVRTDTAGFWKYMNFYGHSKKVLPPIVPIPDDPTTPEDPCDSCPSGYNCEDGKCIPQGGGSGGGLTPSPVIDPIVPWEDEETVIVPTEEEAIEAVECKAEVLHNNGFVELQNGYLTGADENSGGRFFFNTDCYEEVTFYGRLNAYYSTPHSILNFGWVGNSTHKDIEIGLFHYVKNEGDRFRVTFKASGDFRIEVQRIIDSETMYDWQTVEASNVNNTGWWNPTGTSIVGTPAKKLIIHLEGAAYMTNVISTGVTVVPYDALEKRGIYTKADAQGEVPASSGKVISTPTMLGLNDGYNKDGVKYSNGLLTIGYDNGRSASYYYEFDTSAENCDNYSILTNFIFRVEKAGSVEDSIDVYISLSGWMEYGTSSDLTISGNTITSTYCFSNVSDGNALNITFDDITNVEFRIEQEIATRGDWGMSETGCCYGYVDILALYYRNIGSSDWIKIGKGTAHYGWKNYSISLNAEYSKIIVSYVGTFEKPSDDNIVVLYNGMATYAVGVNDNLLVIRDKDNQEIEASNRATGESITIMDRNLGAEEPFICYETSDTSNGWTGKFYQYGNNYGFPSDGIVTPITTDTINLSEYGPGNYYSSNVYRTTSSWDSSNNTDIWGYITNTEEARRGPCPKGWHIPSVSEFESLVTLLKNAVGGTYITEDRFMHILLFGFNGYADGWESTVEYEKRGKLMYLHTSDYISGSKTTAMKGIVYDSKKGYIPYFDYINRNDSCCIRPFKNVTDVPKYTIRFLNFDGTVLQSSRVVAGSTPEYTGSIPTKPSDQQYSYTFIGWSPAITIVSGDQTYTAQYTPIMEGECDFSNNSMTKDEIKALFNVTASGSDFNLTTDGIVPKNRSSSDFILLTTKNVSTGDGVTIQSIEVWYEVESGTNGNNLIEILSNQNYMSHTNYTTTYDGTGMFIPNISVSGATYTKTTARYQNHHPSGGQIYIKIDSEGVYGEYKDTYYHHTLTYTYTAETGQQFLEILKNNGGLKHIKITPRGRASIKNFKYKVVVA